MKKIFKKTISMILIVITILAMLTMSSCGKAKCKNGCGNPADPDCMAGMCDDCCAYWCGLNGCYANHY